MYEIIKKITCVTNPEDSLYFLESFDSNYVLFEHKGEFSDFIYIDLDIYKNVILSSSHKETKNNLTFYKYLTVRDKHSDNVLVDISYAEGDAFYEVTTTIDIIRELYD